MTVGEHGTVLPSVLAQGAAKGHTSGTHRTVPPAETLARLTPLLPRMGITRLANVTGLDTIGIPVVMSVRPNSRSLSVSQGKGLDLDAAKVSAAMESIEGFHAEHVSGPLRLATYDELRAGHVVADPLRLPLSDDHHFRPSLPMLWMAGHDWIGDEQVYVPFQLVHTAYTTRMRWDLVGFAASSTGLASGNHLLEAVSHALCEVIERDATAQFAAMSVEQQQSRQVDLATVDHPDCIALLEKFRGSGIAAAIWDLTSRVGLPVFQCLIAEREEDPHRLLSCASGFGCHPSRHVALLRALTEAAQSRLTIIAGSRDDLLRSGYSKWRDDANVRVWRAQAERQGTASFSAAPTFELATFEDDVALELAAVAQAGCGQAVVIDLTRPEFAVPVVRVIVPGLHDQGDYHAARREAESDR
jgi:ribosomal protein S12 methylthiotransferase accessory factor